MNLTKLLLIIFVVFISATTLNAAVLFNENFDSQADWEPSPGTNDESPSGATAVCGEGDCSSSVATNWTFYRSAGLWFPPTYENTIRIDGDNHRGTSGKAYTQVQESNTGYSGDGWGADGILAKSLSSDYAEIYVQYWMKMDSPFNWRQDTEPTNQDNEDAMKILRIGHYDGSGSFFHFGENGPTAPLYFFDLKYSYLGWYNTHSYRCDPQNPDYVCPIDSVDSTEFEPTSAGPEDSGQAADGNWHKYTFRIKMNTKTGATWNENGIIQFWYDADPTTDTPIHSVTNIRWIGSGTDETIGWNIVGIGGNCHNTYAAESEHGEQGYSIDDVCVGTTAADMNNCTGSSPSTGSPIGGNSHFHNIGIGNSSINFN